MREKEREKEEETDREAQQGGEEMDGIEGEKDTEADR